MVGRAPGGVLDGIVIWYKQLEVELTEVCVRVPGRVVSARLRSLVDGSTVVRLGGVYRLPRRACETATDVAAREAVDAAIVDVLEEAENNREEVAIAGDLQAQTVMAAEWNGCEVNEHDEWLAGVMAIHNLASVCGVEPTYAATGPGGAAVRTTIDHWLARRLSDVLNEIVTHVSISAA
jgi:hypothetical protein